MKKRKIVIKKPRTMDKMICKTNTSTADKVYVRKKMLDNLGVKNPRILDCFCAHGQMWEHAYNKTENYVGVDLDLFLDDRSTIQADNTRYLRQADLDQFDIFDLDAHGMPYEQMHIICKRITWSKRKKIAMCITDGMQRTANLGSSSPTMLKWIGMSKHKGTTTQGRNRDAMILSCIMKSAEEAGAVVKDIVVAKKEGRSGMRYISYILEKK